MNKHIPYIILLTVICLGIQAQNVPNGGFEEWETNLLFEEPEMWKSSNTEAIFSQIVTVEKSTQNYSGDFSLYLFSTNSMDGIEFGYSLCNATVTDGSEPDNIQYEGGFPVTAAPDSIYGYFKYNINENDSALILVSFKKNGEIIGQDYFFLTGTQNNFVLKGFDIMDFVEIPDTATVGFASSFPDNPTAGNSLFVDSIWFSGPDSIPNSDFEVWNTLTYSDPLHWMTSNVLQAFAGTSASATKTSDAHSGDWAIQIESKITLVPSDHQFDTNIYGYLFSWDENHHYQEYSYFPIDFNPGMLQGYYKFAPVENDTAYILIQLKDNVGEIYGGGTILLPADEYTLFSVPLNYPKNVTIDSAYIMAMFKYSLSQNPADYQGEEGTLLYLDDLIFIDPCEGYPEFEIEETATTCGSGPILFAGEGWDEYLWSTGESTPYIDVTGDGEYSVIVIDNITGCHMTDTIVFELPLCDGIEESVAKGIAGVFPNPASDEFSINMKDFTPGIYSFAITSVTGSVVEKFTKSVINSNESVTISLDGYAPGLYTVKINGTAFTYKEKLLIK
jgi:hypothetical protein